jgi:DNA-directed RNA polymerase, beta'' subunit/160 kD subunit
MSTDKITTPGALLLKHSMPTEAAKQNFNLYRPLDKGGMSDLVQMLLKHGGPNAHEHINNLAKLFFNKATEIGASTPLSDYINESDERQALINEFDFKAQKILNDPNKSRAEKQRELGELVSQYDKRIEKQNVEYLVSKGSMAAKMARTGARGNPKQLAVGTSTPLLSSNLKGELVPVVIKKSFAEGMSPAEHIAMSYMGRGNTVLTQLSTALPGALFKQLSPTVFHETITIDDCKTKNGIMVPIEDKKRLVGSYTADTNRLIDEAYYKELKASGATAVKVRSVMTCEAPQGVCKHCYGLMGSGKKPEIGENVGVIAAQSVSEVLTQAMLSTKHKATVGERKGNAYEQASNLLRNPADNFKDEATIAEINGRITDIKKTPLGDYQVFVNEKGHFVPQTQGLKVNIGDKVRKGDPLSTGVINPRKLVALKGLGAGRQYMSQELRGIYGGGLDPRHFEVISKNLMKYVEVIDPGHTGFLPGDKVDVNAVAKYLKKSSREVPIDQAEGHILSHGVHELTPGTLLDANHVEDLKRVGVKTVKVSDNGLKVAPIVPGLQTAKLLDPNWISKLSFSRLKDTLQESAALGAESPEHSTDPIAPYIIGREFGEGEHGQY